MVPSSSCPRAAAALGAWHICWADAHATAVWRFPALERAGPALEWAAPLLAAAGATAATVRVWERDALELHSVGEAAPGLLPTAAWQLNGRHLYVAQLQQGELLPEAEAGAGPSSSTAGAALGGAAGASRQQQQQGQGRQQPDQQQQAEQAVKHVGAWKRELRRQQEAARQAGEQQHAVSVLLFERNGLQHGGFGVPTPADSPLAASAAARGANGYCGASGGTIVEMAWSTDSELLAVVVDAKDAAGGMGRGAVVVCSSAWGSGGWAGRQVCRG